MYHPFLCSILVYAICSVHPISLRYIAKKLIFSEFLCFKINRSWHFSCLRLSSGHVESAVRIHHIQCCVSRVINVGWKQTWAICKAMQIGSSKIMLSPLFLVGHNLHVTYVIRPVTDSVVFWRKIMFYVNKVDCFWNWH